MSSAVYVGMLVGGLSGGVVGDSRKHAAPRSRAIVAAMALSAVGGLGAACSTSAAAMACWRGVAGAGSVSRPPRLAGRLWGPASPARSEDVATSSPLQMFCPNANFRGPRFTMPPRLGYDSASRFGTT